MEKGALLVGMQTGAATMENSVEFPQKTKNGIVFWPGNSTVVIISSQSWNTTSKEPMHPNVHSSTIYNSQVLEATYVCVNKWVDQKTMVHLHNGILCCRKKEGAPTLSNSMDGTGEHYAKWSNPGGERQILCNPTYKWNLINKTNKQAQYNQRHWN